MGAGDRERDLARVAAAIGGHAVEAEWDFVCQQSKGLAGTRPFPAVQEDVVAAPLWVGEQKLLLEGEQVRADEVEVKAIRRRAVADVKLRLRRGRKPAESPPRAASID